MTSDVIRFIHNDKIIEIKDSDPNETVLNYVREKYKKTLFAYYLFFVYLFINSK